MHEHPRLSPSVQRTPAPWTAASGGPDGARPFAGAAERAPRGRLAGKRILVVEDEALLAMDLQCVLEDEGAQVIGPALSLDRALETVAREAAIDGAILDVDLSGREVYPVAAQLRERGVPIVFHTGHGSRIQLAEMFPGSATCTKPTLPDTLIATLLRLAH